MHRDRTIRALTAGFALAARLAAPLAAQAKPTPDCAELAVLAIGAGSRDGPVCRVSLTLPDPHVSLLGASLPLAAGLVSRAAFLPVGDSALVMGDIALEAADLAGVIRALGQAGFDVVAVHRRMLGETPAISFVRYIARGDPRELARRLRQSVGPPLRPRTTSGGNPLVGQPGFVTGVPCSVVRDGVGAGAIEAGPGFCGLTIPRDDINATIGGIAIPSAMGLHSTVSFRETPDRTSIVMAGNFLIEAPRAPAVIAVLAEGGIDVVAVHEHMPGALPVMTSVHFQSRGNAIALAATLRAALEAH